MNNPNGDKRIIEARNPRTGEMDYSFTATSKDEIETIANEIRSNQSAWAELHIDQRAEALKEWANIVANSQDLLDALVIDTGRYFIATSEVGRLSDSIEAWHMIGRNIFAEKEPIQSSAPSVIYKHQYKPFEVVGIVGPWNFPFLISLIDLLPALMAGAATITKPSEITPRFIQPLQATLEKVPELHAVCRYIQGDGETGQDLINNVDAVCFTGSVKTGKMVYESGARNFIPVYAELGGKDPVIVTENADPKAERVFFLVSGLALGRRLDFSLFTSLGTYFFSISRSIASSLSTLLSAFSAISLISLAVFPFLVFKSPAVAVVFLASSFAFLTSLFSASLISSLRVFTVLSPSLVGVAASVTAVPRTAPLPDFGLGFGFGLGGVGLGFGPTGPNSESFLFPNSLPETFSAFLFRASLTSCAVLGFPPVGDLVILSLVVVLAPLRPRVIKDIILLLVAVVILALLLG